MIKLKKKSVIIFSNFFSKKIHYCMIAASKIIFLIYENNCLFDIS